MKNPKRKLNPSIQTKSRLKGLLSDGFAVFSGWSTGPLSPHDIANAFDGIEQDVQTHIIGWAEEAEPGDILSVPDMPFEDADGDEELESVLIVKTGRSRPKTLTAKVISAYTITDL